MKKFLTILGAIGLTATAGSAVVSCGSSQKDDGIAPSADGTVSTTFDATFATTPTSETLAKDFAITGPNNEAVSGAEYTFAPKDVKVSAIVLADTETPVTGTVTVKFKADSDANAGKTVSFNIGLTDSGKTSVTGFTPVTVKVSVPAADTSWEIKTTIDKSQVKVTDNADGTEVTTYFTKDKTINALTEGQAKIIYDSLYGGNIDANKAKAALLAKNGTSDEIEYAASFGGTITKDNYKTASVGGTQVGWNDIKPDTNDGTYQIGFYTSDANTHGAVSPTVHWYWITVSFSK